MPEENTTTNESDLLQPTRDRCHALLGDYLNAAESCAAVQHAALQPAVADDDNRQMQHQVLAMEFAETSTKLLTLISMVAAVGTRNPAVLALSAEIAAAAAEAAETWAELHPEDLLEKPIAPSKPVS